MPATFPKDNTAYLFGSPEDFLAALFGPAQHDAHVECWKADRWLTSREAHAAAANLRCAVVVADIAEEEAHRIARVNNYSIFELRAELYTWEQGAMKGDRFAAPRARQVRRALEIARERNTLLQAAE